MKIYLVGGAIRDNLLGLPVHDQDYVVVGATPAQMTSQGFRPVGRDFPVFLHPKTHAEYALARTEKKIAVGHQGFQFYASPEVSLQEDLKRRDLTINAIAKDEQTGCLIDPFHGTEDIQKHILRHVSEAFTEDPLRILRLARIRAYLGYFDFKIAPETLRLLRRMVQRRALQELSEERIWQEMSRALKTDFPALFFETLAEIGAIDALFAHPNLPSTLPLLTQSTSPQIRFAILNFANPYLYRVPQEFAGLACLLLEKAHPALNFSNFSALEKCMFLKSLDVLRRPQRFETWLEAATIIFTDFPTELFKGSIARLTKIDRAAIAKTCRNPQEINQKILNAECLALA